MKTRRRKKVAVKSKRRFEPVYTARQTQALGAFEEPGVKEVMYGGAKGGGKSVFACFWAVRTCIKLIKRYNIKRSDNPIAAGFLGRKVGKDFKRTTLETFRKMIPSSIYRLRGDPPDIIIDERVKIFTGGLERDRDRDRFNSAEFAFFAIDQAEETTRDDVLSLRAASFGRLVLGGEPVQGKALYTANPKQVWLKRDFIVKPSKDKRYIQALPGDNPYLGQQYVDNLREIFKHRPELLQAYLYGSWNALEGPDQVVKDEWLEEAIHRCIKQPIHKRFLVCEPARFGDDECVINLMDNTDIELPVILPYCRTTEVSSRLAVMSHANGDIPIVVESIGADIGAGIIDELVGMGKTVITFNPAGQSTDPEKYYNLRAEAWSEGAGVLASGVMDKYSNVAVMCPNLDEDTRMQLCVPTYKFRNGKILIEPKADIKARLGRSPDRGDCFIIGLWAWKRVPASGSPERDKRKLRGRRKKTAMSM